MTAVCSKCGAALTERDAFCRKCGARRENTADTSAAKRFCTKCGAPLIGETKFCTKCGAAAGAGATSTTEKAHEFWRELEAGASRGTPPKSAAPVGAPTMKTAGKSGATIPKSVIAGGVIAVLLVVVVATAGIIYAAHRARKHAARMEAADDFEKRISDLADQANKLAQNAPNQAATIPASAAAGNPAGTTPAGSSTSGQSNGGTPAAAPYGWTLENGKLVPAKAPNTEPPPLPKADPVAPVAATGDQARDWALKYERTEGGPEADLVVRTGDINNLGFGWPKGFDPFSGQSTPPHQWPDINKIPSGAPDGTDRIMLGSAVTPGPGDGYSGALNDCVYADQVPKQSQSQTFAVKLVNDCKRDRELTAPTPIVLAVGELPAKIDAVLVQIFADDFQPVPLHSHFQVSLNGTRIPTFEYAINALDQSGPIGKLLSLRLLPEYWPLLKGGTVKLLIDDPTTHVPDGYAVDFVRILVNPHTFKYQVSLAASVVDADKHTPIAGATVTAALESTATDKLGKCELKGLPAGLVVATASAPGYDENSTPVDLVAGQSGQTEIPLHRHEESTAALEKSIAETGTATIYGIHFDTDSSKLRPDSTPALNAVLGLINNRPGSRWIIAGHTDNQGADAHNQALSEARARSVVNWLKGHGVDVNRLAPQGFGATRPVADNATANGRALNRRVEVALAK